MHAKEVSIPLFPSIGAEPPLAPIDIVYKDPHTDSGVDVSDMHVLVRLLCYLRRPEGPRGGGGGCLGELRTRKRGRRPKREEEESSKEKMCSI